MLRRTGRSPLSGPFMDSALRITPRRIHLTRLMSIWRSGGWPCRDVVELDLVAAGWAALAQDAGRHETIRLTDAGIRLLADFRQRNQRSLSAHDRLAARVAANLMPRDGSSGVSCPFAHGSPPTNRQQPARLR